MYRKALSGLFPLLTNRLWNLKSVKSALKECNFERITNNLTNAANERFKPVWSG
ncbi:hypothetical protein LOAG_05955 [Loa loa]|uniref:Uncharacterized protein n=1 Tax=Loa loa TaxID=7209 RepID=A0A1S0TZ57_LOALO|nr:hypothetical protein LOAG_05955 [Loa loa]EFO22531.1 hypothetical protein LOAG_05955 [Loa loa]